MVKIVVAIVERKNAVVVAHHKSLNRVYEAMVMIKIPDHNVAKRN